MFGFLKSPEKKAREQAAQWLELAQKVHHFRRDVLPASEETDLRGRIATLHGLVKARADAGTLQRATDGLEATLRQTGGAFYPKRTLVENVEFFLVAAIVILGIRTYFIQPFEIPTNSMWPTYHGMTPQVYPSRADEPGVLAEAGRFVALGARPRRVDAPAAGEVLIPVFASMQGGRAVAVEPPAQPVTGRSLFVFPTTMDEYTLAVGGHLVTVRVPQDFDFAWVLRDAYFPKLRRSGDPAVDLAAVINRQHDRPDAHGIFWLRTGKFVRRGEPMLAFDILSGDKLFVDRFSYNFVRPRVGQGFVFRTGDIHSPNMRDPRTGKQIREYYIKRLVGVPGDRLQVRQPVLYRNGAPISGAAAFAANNHPQGDYFGYTNVGRLGVGDALTVPSKRYFAMGDNSGDSEDSRYWGFVPERAVVGRPLFVYYPFNRHWGPAR